MASFSLSGSCIIALQEASSHVIRTLREPYGEVTQGGLRSPANSHVHELSYKKTPQSKQTFR